MNDCALQHIALHISCQHINVFAVKLNTDNIGAASVLEGGFQLTVIKLNCQRFGLWAVNRAGDNALAEGRLLFSP